VWVLVAIATGVAVWVVVKTVGQPEIHTQLNRAETSDSRDHNSSPTPTETLAVVETPAPADTPTPAETPKPSDEGRKPLHAEGVTVQVLNGTVKPNAGQVMADRLAYLGYSVVAITESVKAYSETTVFWSTGASRDSAVALAERFGWKSEPKPGNLSPDVSIHVVVGADEGRG
jgi:hypothetical protein